MKTFIAGALAAIMVAGVASAASAQVDEILNVSYDVSRETFADINPAFAASWKKTSGQAIKVNQSHAGSSSQARAVLEGLPADVVTFNQVTDVQKLADGKLLPANWRTRLPNNASPYYSLPAFLVRAGNPKVIKTWDDLAKPGVGIVIPNPKTSGNGRYTYLAAYAYALDKTKDPAKAKDFAKRVLANVVVFDAGGRAATTTFVEKGQGDVLVTFEAEALGTAKEAGASKVQVVTPPVSLLAEFPVAVVDKVADQRGSRPVAEAYLKFLYTPEGQNILARHYYRVSDRAVSAKYRQQFRPTRILTVEQTLGGWDRVNKEHLASGGILDQVSVR